MHVCVWRPEVDIKCISWLLFIFFLEAGSLSELGTHWFMVFVPPVPPLKSGVIDGCHPS